MKETRRPSRPLVASASLVAFVLAAALLRADPPAGKAAIRIDASAPVVKSSPGLGVWGLFFEEINHAGDGGLYAELVRNGSFEDAQSPEAWTAVGGANFRLETADLLNAAQKRCLRIEASAAGAGASNEGYWGIAARAGGEYRFALFARSAGGTAPALTVRLEKADGTPLGSAAAISGIGAGWKRLTATLRATGTDPAARLAIRLDGAGAVAVDAVSLFPADTWKGRENGLRSDLAGLLDDLRPAFIRFPGGCFVEGNRLANATRWKTTIGPVWERPGHANAIWGYRSTDGLGYHEYLQMCEDMGAEPLFVINCGMAHEDVVPMEALDEWVGDALDAVEYANGSPDTRWGGLRARNGHREPFGLKYLEIGNENGGPAYEERYARFWDALKAKHPDLQLIANVPVRSRPMDILDEHYYSSPDWFRSQAGKYDRYDRKGPKIYVGEYACTQDCGTGNLKAAIGEAAFMTGMERNSDIVIMASYAPLFVHVRDRRWNPDAIGFDSARSYGTPSYHAQRLFGRNPIDRILPVKIEAVQEKKPVLPSDPGAIGLGTWATRSEYRDIEVRAGDQVLFREDFAAGAGKWKAYKGDWKVEDGAYRQSSAADDCRTTAGDPAWRDYTLTLKARKISGAEGFLVMFQVRNDDNWCWWNIGGWGNSRHAIERCRGGGKATIGDSVPGGVEMNRWYDVRIELKGPRIRCFLDGKLIHDVEEGPAAGFFASAGVCGETGDLVVKVVNYGDAPQAAEIRIDGAGTLGAEGKATILAGEPAAENSVEEPRKVAPATRKVEGLGKEIPFTFDPWSLTVLRIPMAK